MEAIALHFDTLKQIDTLRHYEAIQRATSWNLVNQGHPGKPNWITRQRRQMLCQIGHSLVQLGQWLEHHAITPTAS